MTKIEIPVDTHHENCPWCNAYTMLKFANIRYKDNPTNFNIGYCNNCNEYIIQFKDVRKNAENFDFNKAKSDCYIYPDYPADIREAPQYLPDSVKEYYTESRLVFNKSIRASLVLLRATLEDLCKEESCKGKDLYEKCRNLIEKYGLNDIEQNIIEIIRVTGNDVIHNNTISKDDLTKYAKLYFNFFIAISDKIKFNKDVENIKDITKK